MTYDPMGPLHFKWAGAPCIYDPRTRLLSTTLEHTDPALKSWIESLFGTGQDETDLIARLEAAVAAGKDTTAIEAELVAFYRTQSMGARV